MVGRNVRSRGRESHPPTQQGSSRAPVEIINCYDEDDDVIIEENGEKEGEQLVMECEEEELTPEQQRAYEKAEKEYENCETELRTYREANVPIVEMNNSQNGSAGSKSTPGRKSAQTSSSVEVSRRSSARISSTNPGSVTSNSVGKSRASSSNNGKSRGSTDDSSKMVTLLVDSRTGGVIGRIPDEAANKMSLPTGTLIQRASRSSVQPSTPVLDRRSMSSATVTARTSVSPAKPSRASAQVGPPPITTRTVELKGSPGYGKPSNGPLSQFPALFTFPKPLNGVSDSVALLRRSKLDSKVKAALILTATKFTEFLIHSGLLRNKQTCQTHKTPKGQEVSLKLAMYNDAGRFPTSGGYVWISDCCPDKFVSVFRGSVFEGKSHSPVTTLKLIYHWACQTNPTNVVSWVKTDASYINGFYRVIKTLCALSVYSVMPKFGGPGENRFGFYLCYPYQSLVVFSGKVVELAAVHLHTSSPGQKLSSVEILCVFDRSSRLVRLLGMDRARTAPSNRYAAYRQCIAAVVHCKSTIIVDNSLDITAVAGALPTARFAPATSAKDTEQVVCYLTKHVPKIFANTLGTLDMNAVQPFLDELAWREKWGHSAEDAYDNLCKQLAFETKASEERESLLSRLMKLASTGNQKTFYALVPQTAEEPPVAAAPAARTRTVQQKTVTPVSAAKQGGTKRPAMSENRSAIDEHALAAKRLKPTEMVRLGEYYYGQMASTKTVPAGSNNVFKCPVCQKVFNFNVAFTRHLFMHLESARSFSIDLGDLTLCKYCFRNFGTPYAMQTHVEEVHMRRNNSLVCGICNEPFKTRMDLIGHMHGNHVQSELPYGCELCGFRSSFHRLQRSPREGGEEEIMMPKPDEKKRRKGPLIFQPSIYPSKMLKLDLKTLSSEYLCQECHQPLTSAAHLKTSWSCSHCRYSTCCDAMAQTHLARFHGTKPDFDMSKPVCLKKTMFCVCGFGTYSGNKLATHLALCGKKSAYPSRHRASLATVSAQSATFPELITLEDDDEDHGGAMEYANDSDDDMRDMDDGFGDGIDCRVKNGGENDGGKSGGRKRRRRRRHGVEDINSVWLKAIWSFQNIPFPDSDALHAEDYEYVDTETPEALQAVGLHKLGALKKVLKKDALQPTLVKKQALNGSLIEKKILTPTLKVESVAAPVTAVVKNCSAPVPMEIVPADEIKKEVSNPVVKKSDPVVIELEDVDEDPVLAIEKGSEMIPVDLPAMNDDDDEPVTEVIEVIEEEDSVKSDSSSEPEIIEETSRPSQPETVQGPEFLNSEQSVVSFAEPTTVRESGNVLADAETPIQDPTLAAVINELTTGNTPEGINVDDVVAGFSLDTKRARESDELFVAWFEAKVGFGNHSRIFSKFAVLI
ncbi:unnamed protein product [Notodromas monacha]|uniref:C2H2-type domain-containing protein n=1 Tax=Notodromas monacha TaxID=399045 RepID=A0A7R9BQ26_9CRUS|nr:unnamed protein product [Notodromas monacha]CAG0918706.1 unnamed protein product [Notodromas monacha]